MLIDILFSWFGVIIVLLVILAQAIKITREYERGVIFRLGRFAGIRGLGLFLIVSFIDKMVKLDFPVVTLDFSAQKVITKDNIPINVDAFLYFKVSDPQKATIEVENYLVTTSQISQISLRRVVGALELDEILAEREKINQRLHEIIDRATGPWGIKETEVKVKHVEIPEGMERAITKQAEAERKRGQRLF